MKQIGEVWEWTRPERDECSLFHRKRTINRLVKRKSVKYQLFDDEKSWTIDFALELKGGTLEMSGS